MPHLDPDGLMDPPCHDIKCDRCGAIENYEMSYEIQEYWMREIFFRRPKQDFHYQTFCKACAVLLTPYVYRLRDIDELTLYVNKLKGAINEKRTKNNWATPNAFSERCEGRTQWRSRDSESRSDSQAGEEHF
jgi:hypothetical protein